MTRGAVKSDDEVEGVEEAVAVVVAVTVMARLCNRSKLPAGECPSVSRSRAADGDRREVEDDKSQGATGCGCEAERDEADLPSTDGLASMAPPTE